MVGPETLVLVGLCLTGVVTDIRSRRLPNWLALAAWLAGLGAAFLSGGFSATLSPLVHSLLALIGGMILFRIGFIGAGDAKFYAGLAAWFALPSGFFLLLNVALAGAVLVIAMLILSRLRSQKREDRRRSMSELPYGVAIAVGVMVSWTVQSGLLAQLLR